MRSSTLLLLAHRDRGEVTPSRSRALSQAISRCNGAHTRRTGCATTTRGNAARCGGVAHGQPTSRRGMPHASRSPPLADSHLPHTCVRGPNQPLQRAQMRRGQWLVRRHVWSSELVRRAKSDAEKDLRRSAPPQHFHLDSIHTVNCYRSGIDALTIIWPTLSFSRPRSRCKMQPA
jgi:hypothetical protein